MKKKIAEKITIIMEKNTAKKKDNNKVKKFFYLANVIISVSFDSDTNTMCQESAKTLSSRACQLDPNTIIR